MVIQYIFTALCALMCFGFAAVLYALLVDALKDPSYSRITKVASTLFLVPFIAFVIIGGLILPMGQLTW